MKFRVEIQSLISGIVEAENEEDAKMIAMEMPKFGEELMQEAYVSDVEEIVVSTDSEEKGK